MSSTKSECSESVTLVMTEAESAAGDALPFSNTLEPDLRINSRKGTHDAYKSLILIYSQKLLKMFKTKLLGLLQFWEKTFKKLLFVYLLVLHNYIKVYSFSFDYNLNQKNVNEN